MTKDARPLMAVIARNFAFSEVLMDYPVTFDARIEDNFKATIDFTFCSVLYTFTVEKWARRGLTGFLNLFHQCGARDMITYGIRIEDDNGAISFYENDNDIVQNADGTVVVGAGARQITLQQKINCIEQGCKDVISCLSLVCRVHPRSMLEYSVWYLESHSTPTSYGEFITLVSCHCIVHNDFMAPNVHWTLAEFKC